jgi:hypothetical protein
LNDADNLDATRHDGASAGGKRAQTPARNQRAEDLLHGYLPLKHVQPDASSFWTLPSLPCLVVAAGNAALRSCAKRVHEAAVPRNPKNNQKKWLPS